MADASSPTPSSGAGTEASPPRPQPAGAPAPQGGGGRGRAKWFRHLSASSLGIEIALTIVLGWWCGRWLERNVTHWSPWTTTLGVLFGCAAGVIAIRRSIVEYREYLAELAAEREAETAKARRAHAASGDEAPH